MNYRDEREEYAIKRCRDQQHWYSKRANRYKKITYWVSGAIVVMSILLPFTTSALPTNWEYRWISVVLSLGIGVATGISGLFRWRELWISYRSAEEALKREYSFYIVRAREYATSADVVSLFVERIEEILSGEHEKWVYAEKTRSNMNKNQRKNGMSQNETTSVL